MTDDNSGPLINIGGDLSKPADTLVKKIAGAMGGIFEPHQKIRIAKADAEVAIIKAKSDIETTEIHRRAMHRFVEEETKKQVNIEAITMKALPQLKDDGDPSKIEDDWITNFFDKCRIISDDEMQNLWSHVLAGQVNSPGAYSKRTVNFLSTLDKKEANLFQKLCGFIWTWGNQYPLIFEVEDSIYADQGLDNNALRHLEHIGLIKFNSLHGFKRTMLPKNIKLQYFKETVSLELPNESSNSLYAGKVMLTQIGQELAQVCKSKPVEGFLDYVIYTIKKVNDLTDKNSDSVC